jgi:HSP20 family protein
MKLALLTMECQKRKEGNMKNLVPWRKKEEALPTLLDFGRDLDGWFDFSLSRLFDGDGPAAWTPAVDVLESKDDVVVKADVPGLSKGDIEVSVRNGALEIRGEKKEERRTQRKGVVRTERSFGSFYRSIPLPDGVNESKIKASYKNGVLEVKLPKVEGAKSRQQKIAIE